LHPAGCGLRISQSATLRAGLHAMSDQETITGGWRSIVAGVSSAARDLAGTPGSPPDALGDAEEWRRTPLIPERYRIRATEEGRFLLCEEAPRVRVSVNASKSFSEAEARDLGKRVILLDGAGSFPPLLDNKNKIYNLDHHEGCERTFTLATCEQALLVVHGGVQLAEGDWTVYANEPDLDTVLAIWCLLNYERLQHLDERSRDILFPLIRLEGAIDANGMELARLCGLPERALAEAQHRLDRLLAREREIKARGLWFATDLLQFTREALMDIDRLIFSEHDFSEYAHVEEVYGHVEIGRRRVAVACRDDAGIYEVERSLKKRWGDQLALIVLEKEPHRYTLRRPAALSDIDLRAAYATLNLLDPAVDGRPPGKTWGGSDSIGGSPRPAGTLLGPGDLLKVLRLAYRTRKARARLGRLVLALALGLGVVAFAAAIAWLGTRSLPGLPAALEQAARLSGFSVIAVLTTWLLTRRLSDHRPWLFGRRRPAWGRWLWLAPVVVVAWIPCRAWFPQAFSPQPEHLGALAGSLVLAAFAVEYGFRGLVHGVLILDAPVQMPGGPWFLSRAAVVSALAYALAILAATPPWIFLSPAPWIAPVEEIALVVAAALSGGLALGVIRERSLSIWPGVALQILAVSAGAGFWLGWAS
jgi:hypothetical protein